MDEYHKLIIKGVVQGVGFRPYIYKIAKKYNLKGYVKNIGYGVEIIVNDKDFFKKLTNLPPLARIDSHTNKKYVSKEKFRNFIIRNSSKESGETILPPDIFLCNDCLNELNDKNNRRNNYYFITCTNCGPRFTMIEDYPYDRPLTSMKNFPMCKICKKEYENPNNRRYHAQTVACKDCGPKLKLISNDKCLTEKSDLLTIKKAAEIIKSGMVLAIKGVGGFHLCSLIDESIVKNVRITLARENKPFAIMVKDISQVKKIAKISKAEEELLLSKERPIVVLDKKYKKNLTHISELDSIGVILPYTAMHYMLFNFIDEPLLMTSCNFPGEPVSKNEIIADNFLTHEREIVNRCDDSVLKIIDDKILYLRRSRGFSPNPVRLQKKYADTIALGAELNSVICCLKNKNAFLSQYIGQTSKPETLEFLKETTELFIKLTRLKPKIIACDLHPDYNSTNYAKELSKKYKSKIIQIQHHKAHVASVAVEHNLKNYIGIAMDGLGYGEDNTIWGGEVFDVENISEFKRIGHLEIQPQLSGDSATINPKKMLFGILSKFLAKKELIKLNVFNENESTLYYNQISESYNVEKTSSAGRILDAASAFLGFCDKRTYDGRPAILLECAANEKKPYEFEPIIIHERNTSILLTTPLFEFLLKNRNKDQGRLAATVQMYLAKGMYKIADEYAKKQNKKIVFSGGVAYNKMISSFMIEKGVLINKEVPCGDGGVSLGQAAIANEMMKKR